jgi:hypothetical protein
MQWLPSHETLAPSPCSSALESEDSGVREAALAAAQQLAADNECLRILQQASTGCIACFACR